jgi:hypothetical protein
VPRDDRLWRLRSGSGRGTGQGVGSGVGVGVGSGVGVGVGSGVGSGVGVGVGVGSGVGVGVGSGVGVGVGVGSGVGVGVGPGGRVGVGWGFGVGVGVGVAGSDGVGVGGGPNVGDGVGVGGPKVDCGVGAGADRNGEVGRGLDTGTKPPVPVAAGRWGWAELAGGAGADDSTGASEAGEGAAGDGATATAAGDAVGRPNASSGTAAVVNPSTPPLGDCQMAAAIKATTARPATVIEVSRRSWPRAVVPVEVAARPARRRASPIGPWVGTPARMRTDRRGRRSAAPMR